MELKVICLQQEETIREIVQGAFSAAPWNDRWDHAETFHRYLEDLIGNPNSLSLGLYCGEELVAVSLGRLKHWFDGIEYCIDELCVKPARQGQGLGSVLLQQIRAYAQARHYREISLRTNRQAPAYRFYQKNGFEEMADQVFFRFSCG